MYLTKLILDPRDANAKQCMRDCQRMHCSVMSLFHCLGTFLQGQATKSKANFDDSCNIVSILSILHVPANFMPLAIWSKSGSILESI